MFLFNHQWISRRVWIGSMLLAMLLYVPTNTMAQPPDGGDLGDAPDSTNHAGVQMNAYPMVAARYPTVFDPGIAGPQGPLHRQPKADSWLGADVSAETDADLLPDADGVRNITPPANISNSDFHDDGVFPVNPGGEITLPQCKRTRFNYAVTGAPMVAPHQAYVNVWFDFNRDGDWQDTLTCVKADGTAVTVPEWAVANQPVMVNPGSNVVMTPLFPSFHATGPDPLWMRITLGDGPAPQSALGSADGRGPAGGYAYGETEDYRLIFVGGQDFNDPDDLAALKMIPDVGYYSGN